MLARLSRHGSGDIWLSRCYGHPARRLRRGGALRVVVQRLGTLQPIATRGGSKVALLLPLSAPGETQKIAIALKQAAEMALIDAGGGISFIVKDTGGSPDGAKAAADAALNEGAELILGPLLAEEVRAVAPVAQGRGINVIAFSSVSAVAGNGTFLMSFLPEEEIAGVMRFAASKGYRSIAALYPASQYGATVERALVAGGRPVWGLDRRPAAICPCRGFDCRVRHPDCARSPGPGSSTAAAGRRRHSRQDRNGAVGKRNYTRTRQDSRHRPVGRHGNSQCPHRHGWLVCRRGT